MEWTQQPVKSVEYLMDTLVTYSIHVPTVNIRRTYYIRITSYEYMTITSSGGSSSSKNATYISFVTKKLIGR